MRRLPLSLCSFLVAAAMLGGCGGSLVRRPPAPHARTLRPAPVRAAAGLPRRRPLTAGPRALVTAESENRLLIVDLRTGAIKRRIAVPAGPQYVAAEPGLAVVTSPNAGAATLLEGEPLRTSRVLPDFGAPHITEISPDGKHAYVLDDARGTLTVIRLNGARASNTTYVGAGAHHATSSPDQRRLWIALGESARTIVIVDTSDISRPRVIGRFDPGFPAHDLSFAPDGRRVWITSASGPDVTVFRASDRRLLFRVAVGAPPQHIAFDGAYAYLTSGYGSTLEKVAAATGTVIKRTRVPYGSFELDAADGFVATASLLDGKLAIFTPQLKLLHVVRLASATRDVAISYP
jgi:DNA-binding beta-propeller fold protein YncE